MCTERKATGEYVLACCLFATMQTGLWNVVLRIRVFSMHWFQLLVLTFVTLCTLMDFPIKINAMRMGVSIIYFKGSQVRIS